MIKKQIYEIDEYGYIKEIHVGDFDLNGQLMFPIGNYITVDIPQSKFFKPKWNGSIWIEGATQEEIDELTKVVPSPPTEMDLVKAELTRTNEMVLELTELILGRM